jgi:hypothetical protein
LRIPSDDPETPVLTAFVTNARNPLTEAQTRMAPVLSASTIPEAMKAGESYALTWSLEGYPMTAAPTGYENDYVTYIALFDCTGITDGSCGAYYSDTSRFAEAGPLTATSVTAGKWTYNGAQTKSYNYSWNFTVPSTREGGTAWAALPGTEIVVRLYFKNEIDAERNKPSVSLLIPGNQSLEYYDTAGRRIVKTIIP